MASNARQLKDVFSLPAATALGLALLLPLSTGCENAESKAASPKNPNKPAAAVPANVNEAPAAVKQLKKKVTLAVTTGSNHDFTPLQMAKGIRDRLDNTYGLDVEILENKCKTIQEPCGYVDAFVDGKEISIGISELLNEDEKQKYYELIHDTSKRGAASTTKRLSERYKKFSDYLAAKLKKQTNRLEELARQ